MRHLHYLTLLFACIAWLPLAQAQPEPFAISITQDLSATAEEARKDHKVILLLVSRRNCHYCHLMKREILDPMVLSGEYDDRLIIRELLIDEHEPVRDFDGTQGLGQDFAQLRGIQVTPTLLFLDPDGEELTESIIGIRTPEMFYYYVDAAVNDAVAALSSNQGKR